MSGQLRPYYVDCPIPNVVTCNVCNPGKSYRNHADLNRHLKKKHQQSIAWQCTTCKDQFNDIRTCKTHQRRSGHGVDALDNSNNNIVTATPRTTDTTAEADLATENTTPIINTEEDTTVIGRPNKKQREWMSAFIYCNSIEEIETVTSQWILEI